MAPVMSMFTVTARLDTFEQPQQLTKIRRASSQSSRRREGKTAEWPHKTPKPEDLARAGFFFKPSQDSDDNVQCFMCEVKLDGWEEEDDAISEHLAHSKDCAWAIALSVTPRPGYEESRDPYCEELVAARTKTFAVGDGWPHEGKRNWKCKTKQMVDAGWCLDPGATIEDAVSCFYCQLGLDGWEPKDDPIEEHHKREPDCPFFALIEMHGRAPAKKGKAKAKGKAAGRGSTASKTSSRASVQSAISTISDHATLADFDDEPAAADDSVLTAATTTSQSTTRGGKKAARPKAAAKGTKGKKQTKSSQQDDEMEVDYPDLSAQMPSQQPDVEDVEAPVPAQKTRKTARNSKQVDSSVVDSSLVEPGAKKTTRGRKAKAPLQQTPEPEDYNKRNSEASAQLLDELEQSLSIAEPDHEATPQAMKPPRGVKRTSDGSRKAPDSSVISIEAPAVHDTTNKGKPQNTVSLASSPSASLVEFPWATGDLPASESEDLPKKGAKGKKAAPKKAKGKGKKTSSARSSKATVVAAEQEINVDEPEDLDRDEMEIEAELERIAAEAKAAEDAVRAKAVQREQERVDEFEPSPSHAQRISLQPGSANAARGMSTHATASPAGSDKENDPGASQEFQANQPIFASPTKKTVLLAPGTPNRSPSRRDMLSPSKQISRLQSSAPWSAVDLDAVLLASPQPSPGTLGQRLAGAAGSLTSPERAMTIEEWVRWRAEKSDEELRRKCEAMVSVFEKEGMRAMQSLQGLATS